MVTILFLVPAVLLFSDTFGIWHPNLNILRWIITGCAALLFVVVRRSSILVLVILVLILVLFNPLLPVHLSHLAFRNLEIVVGICLVAARFVMM